MTLLTLALLVPLAAVMAGSTAVFVRWAADCRSTLRASIVVFLLLMMTGMLAGALVYELHPGRASAVAGLWLASVVMSASVAVVFVAFVREMRRSTTGEIPSSGFRPTAGFVATIAGLVLANELLMGWTFGVAAGGLPRFPTPGGAGAVAFLGLVTVSPWFLLTMAAEMFLTTLLLRDRLPRSVVAVLLTQAGIMVFSPPAFGVASWIAGSTYVSSALMIGLFVFLFEFLYRYRSLTLGLAAYLAELVGVYALMMVGLFVWFYFATPTFFALAVVLEMIVFYAAVCRPGAFSAAPTRPWQERTHWTFALLSSVFVAEVGMGAVLSLQLEPATYVGGFPFLPLAGTPAGVLANAVSNGFWFLATSTASTWFLVMMGLEMGALVVFKYRESRHLENRIRLLLMMGSYGAFAVFYPSLYFGLLFPNAPLPNSVPVLGWSMGIGSYPLAAGVFGTLLLTYAITGALVVLFGRRVVCSVFCTAPLMYQGTTIGAMKSFNRTGPVGRKYLSSRFSGLYTATSAGVMTALVGTSILSYLDTVGRANVYIQGNDPSVFLFVLSFSVVWYLLFVSIPYAGNYNCVTMGWCYTGTITQAFQKVGFFKLKVRDKNVCWACTTLDCAKGCPVGLVDMPGHFRQKGEFRSTKCCGVGDCVEACPHDNLYVADVRHWLRRRLGLPESRPRRSGLPLAAARVPGALAARPDGPLLPMAGVPAATVGRPTAAPSGSARPVGSSA